MKLIPFPSKCWLAAAAFVLTHSALQAQQFSRISSGPIVNTAGDSRSVNWVDVNGDGFVDCMITNGPAQGQNNFLWLNDGQGGFTLVQSQPVVNDGEPSDGATWADTDNDGDADCFVANWYGVDNMFYVNEGNGAFTEPVGLVISDDAGYSETGSWGDYDNDGLVDLYVTNSATDKKNYLYHNDGGNTFSRIASGPMVDDALESRCVNWTDLDADGDVDLFVTNEGGVSENIYRNDGGGVFTRLTTGPLLTDGGHTMSSSWGDIDNDGDLDVFLANAPGYNALFRNDGNFTFVKLINDTTAQDYGSSLSSAWSDVDNDADLDLFVTQAFNSSQRWVNKLFLNDGGGHFTLVGATEPFEQDSTWSYGCAFADYDNDGFEDLAVATCRFGGQDAPDLLYHNNGNANHWLTVSLEGVQSNRSAIGARVFLTAVIGGDTVQQMREVSAQSSYCGQNDLRVHFGLGASASLITLGIDWPSGIQEFLGNLPVDTFLHVVEGMGIMDNDQEMPALEEGFLLFPNPAHTTVTLQCTGNGFAQGTLVSVFDTQGRLLQQQQPVAGSSSLEMDVSAGQGFAPGLHLVQITSPRQSETLRLLVR